MAKGKPSNSKRGKKKKLTPGPKPDILKIEGDWQDAIKTSLTKKKPAQGWPK
jgi:hypothetical protein